MNNRLYLLWCPRGWGIYSPSSCPDTGAFSEYMYKEYEFPKKHWKKVFNKLLDIKWNLSANHIVPTKDNTRDIFPDISDLLKPSSQKSR